ncbi:MAG: DEAD/DEAH box helicase, partial [Candidatus Odinarchaeia archaeon]
MLGDRNFVISIPTASGKTLIAEICMLDKLIKHGGKAIYLIPLRALAYEKFEDFKKYNKLGFKVAFSTGDLDVSEPNLEKYDIIILTNEKMDSLIRHNTRWLNEIRIIICDEIHLLNDPQRGVTLEVVIAKLRKIVPDAKILALSATIKNSSEIAEWLNAELIESDWRPVKLKEGVFLDNRIFFSDGETLKINNQKDDPI